MLGTIIAIIIAAPILMNAIGIDWEDITMWFASGGNYNIF